jgi:hypothetical protein
MALLVLHHVHRAFNYADELKAVQLMYRFSCNMEGVSHFGPPKHLWCA